MIGSKPKWLDQSLFYDRISQVEQVVHDAREYRDRDESGPFATFIDEHRSTLELADAAKAARKQMQAVRKERGKWQTALDRGEVTQDDYRPERIALDAKEGQVTAAFNRLWNESLSAQ